MVFELDFGAFDKFMKFCGRTMICCRYCYRQFAPQQSSEVYHVRAPSCFLCVQFVVQFSRLTPQSEQVLTGGIGLLSQKDLDEFDQAVSVL